MLGFLGSSTVAACVVGVDGPAFAQNATWETRAGQLEEASGTVYSAAAEGMWAGKSGSHVAKVVSNGDGTVTASCTHPMVDADVAATPPVAGHWITTMYARDVATGNVIHLEEFVTRGPGKVAAASMTFTIPTGVTRIKVFTHCNEHDTWVSDETDVG
jgi:hypothetical protein